ncbi:Serine/arginine repetitive matrix protein 1 [Pseudocyphellaria aurata]|nr:Serine/arginine repetitive matrix protein 1 [Pseudocyphellaria aurata]
MAMSVDAKLLKQTKFPLEFNQKVDMKKVNVEVMKKWIAGKISEILGSEDDVVIELCFNLLEGARFPDIKVLQIQLTGFLDKDTPSFCKELWTLCLSAQSNAQGVPKELLEAKKLELIQEKIDAEKAAEEANKRKEQEKVRDRNVDNIRQRERGERGRGQTRGLHRLGAVVRLADTTIALLRQGVMLILIFQAAEIRAVWTIEDVLHRHIKGPCPIQCRDRGPPLDIAGVEMTTATDHLGVATPPADLQRQYAEAPVGMEGDGIEDVVIERDPLNRQKLLAHVPLEEIGEDALPPFHLVAPLHRPGRETIGEGARYHLYQGDTRVDYRKDRRHQNERRYSRSRSRSEVRSTRPAIVPVSRSPSPDRRRDRKRHRSIQRYAPAGRRRRNTSSVSSPIEKRRRTADSSGGEGNSPAPEPPSSSSPKAAQPPVGKSEEPRSPTLTATELRERLLREKVMALRRSSGAAAAKGQTVTDGASKAEVK